MKTCPKCQTAGNDADKFCAKCGYPYRQEAPLSKNMDQEYRRVVRWSRGYFALLRVILFFLILFSFVLACSLAATEPWLAAVMAMTFVASVGFFVSVSRLSRAQEKVRPYTPKARFKFYRRTTQQRFHALRRARNLFYVLSAAMGISFILIVSVGHASSSRWGEIFFSLLLMIVFYSMAMNNQAKSLRVKYHQPIDDAAYFELEELGLVKETDVILSLYKDFLSFKSVGEGSKILILTQDALVCLVFSDRTHAQKIAVPLKKVDELGIFTPVTDKTFNGLIITLGRQKQYLRIVLKGASLQDSPEEFVARFLAQLDNALLHRPHGGSIWVT